VVGRNRTLHLAAASPAQSFVWLIGINALMMRLGRKVKVAEDVKDEFGLPRKSPDGSPSSGHSSPEQGVDPLQPKSGKLKRLSYTKPSDVSVSIDLVNITSTATPTASANASFLQDRTFSVATPPAPQVPIPPDIGLSGSNDERMSRPAPATPGPNKAQNKAAKTSTPRASISRSISSSSADTVVGDATVEDVDILKLYPNLNVAAADLTFSEIPPRRPSPSPPTQRKVDPNHSENSSYLSGEMKKANNAVVSTRVLTPGKKLQVSVSSEGVELNETVGLHTSAGSSAVLSEIQNETENFEDTTNTDLISPQIGGKRKIVQTPGPRREARSDSTLDSTQLEQISSFDAINTSSLTTPMEARGRNPSVSSIVRIFQAEVLFDYVASSKVEVSIKAGELVKVESQDAGWSYIQTSDNTRQGYAPTLYLRAVLGEKTNSFSLSPPLKTQAPKLDLVSRPPNLQYQRPEPPSSIKSPISHISRDSAGSPDSPDSPDSLVAKPVALQQGHSEDEENKQPNTNVVSSKKITDVHKPFKTFTTTSAVAPAFRAPEVAESKDQHLAATKKKKFKPVKFVKNMFGRKKVS